LLRIGHIVLAVNKMDLVNFDQAVYDKIVGDFQAFAKGLDNLPQVTPIPMSALNGDNVVDKSDSHALVHRPIAAPASRNRSGPQLKPPPMRRASPCSGSSARFPTATDAKLGNLHDYRGFAGRMASGTFRVGDDVLVYPSEMKIEDHRHAHL
jgi:sulfate adenylyltransferase subunit 1 (EFTu-like GTPase family)